MPTPQQFRFVEGAQAESLADAPWFQVFDDPALQALIKRGDRQQPRSASRRGARRGGARARRHREVVSLSAGRRVAPVTARGATTAAARWCRRRGHVPPSAVTDSSWRGSSICSASSGGRTKRRWRWRWPASRPPRRDGHARRRCRVELLPAARARPSARHRPADARHQRPDGHLLPEPTGRRRVESARARSDPALRAQTAAAIPDIEQQIATVENEISLLLGRPPGPIERGAALRSALPPPIPPGLPTSLLERRPDVAEAEQFLVAANADIGAAKALFYPTISLTGFLGGVSGDLTTFLGAVAVSGPLEPGCCSRSTREVACVGTTRRHRRDSIRRWPCIRRPPSTAIEKWPMRW